jgi:hypothetical protein
MSQVIQNDEQERVGYVNPIAEENKATISLLSRVMYASMGIFFLAMFSYMFYKGFPSVRPDIGMLKIEF